MGIFWMPLLPWRNCSELSYQLPCSLETTSSAFAPFSCGVQILHPCHYFRDGTHIVKTRGSLQPTQLCPGLAQQATPAYPSHSPGSIIIVIVKSKGSTMQVMLLLSSSLWTLDSLSLPLILLWNVPCWKHWNILGLSNRSVFLFCPLPCNHVFPDSGTRVAGPPSISVSLTELHSYVACPLLMSS